MTLLTLPTLLCLMLAEAALFGVGRRSIAPVHPRAGRAVQWGAAAGLIGNGLAVALESAGLLALALGDYNTLVEPWGPAFMMVWIGSVTLAPLGNALAFATAGWAMWTLAGQIRGTDLDERAHDDRDFGG